MTAPAPDILAALIESVARKRPVDIYGLAAILASADNRKIIIKALLAISADDGSETEFERARALACRLLDDSGADPDDALRVLSRNLIRSASAERNTILKECIKCAVRITAGGEPGNAVVMLHTIQKIIDDRDSSDTGASDGE